MEIIKPGTLIDFMRYRTPVVAVSVTLVVLSIASLFYPKPNYGIDFAGGTELQLAFQGDVGPGELREELGELGYRGADVVSVEGRENTYMLRIREVTTFGQEQVTAVEGALDGAFGEGTVREVRVSPGGDKLTIRLTRGKQDADYGLVADALRGEGLSLRAVSGADDFAEDDPRRFVQDLAGSEDARYEVLLEGVGDELVANLQERLGERGPDTPERIEWVGPKAGEQLRDAAVKSLLYAIAFIMVYVAFRFDLRFAPGGVLAMFHDAVITLGIYVLVQKEVNLTTVAALLTILGYSINDTIVVYDRIRENMGRLKDRSLRELINLSTSQMLSRTIVTSGTTLLSVIAFFIWGTDVIRDIAFALFCGILIGTYSSIYIAAPVTEYMDKRFFSPEAQKKAKRRRAAASA
ncbi:MAG: protein translocase subunit SecF [Myxococcota bacterium]